MCHAPFLAAHQTLMLKGDAVTRSSDRPQRDAEPHDENAKNEGTEEGEIDQALADSFPASDAPPWTLGVASAPSRGIRKPQRQRD